MSRRASKRAVTSDVDREAEKALLEAALAGEREAKSALVDRFARLVYAAIERTLKPHRIGGAAREELVEELFVEVFLALFERGGRRLRQWSGQCSLASWIRLVSASVTIDRLRRERA